MIGRFLFFTIKNYKDHGAGKDVTATLGCPSVKLQLALVSSCSKKQHSKGQFSLPFC
jgi:hypothetical protein